MPSDITNPHTIDHTTIKDTIPIVEVIISCRIILRIFRTIKQIVGYNRRIFVNNTIVISIVANDLIVRHWCQTPYTVF